jgi:hypothetical protein
MAWFSKNFFPFLLERGFFPLLAFSWDENKREGKLRG